jgi:hypothetical protein
VYRNNFSNPKKPAKQEVTKAGLTTLMLVGDGVLLFNSVPPDVENTVSKFIAYRRNMKSSGMASNLGQVKKLQAQFATLRRASRGMLNELNPDVKSIQAQITQLASVHLEQQRRPSWPDFGSVWDPDVVTTFSMLLGFVAGPIGRRGLPSPLEFPPRDLQTIMTKDNFYFNVAEYLIHTTPLGPQASPDQAYFFSLAQQSVFVNIMLLTASYGARFQLERNFHLDKTGAEPRLRASFMSRSIAKDMIPGLVHATGGPTNSFPPLCTHSILLPGHPVEEQQPCYTCVEQNSHETWSEESEQLQFLLRVCLVRSEELRKSEYLRNKKMSYMDFVYFIVDVERKQDKGSRLAFLKQVLEDLKHESLVPEGLTLDSGWIRNRFYKEPAQKGAEESEEEEELETKDET